MFINFSNHPSEGWSVEQRRAAEKFGELRDLAFPDVSPAASTEEVVALAEYYTGKILGMNPTCVMCQGEFSLAMAVIARLQARGIRCVCACSERRVIENPLTDGKMQKTSIYEFCQFREYDKYN